MRIVALDVGSSSVRAVAYDEHGEAEPGDAHIGTAVRDADELAAACLSVLASVGTGDALAISCFWHSLVPVDGRNRPLARVSTWLDLDAAPPPLEAAEYHRRTGCFLHPSYWPARVLKLRAEGVRPVRYLSFADYLFLMLTGETATSVSMASGTGLYDPNRLDWDEETLDAVGVRREQLPPVSDETMAGVRPPLGDGACANVGAGCVTRGRVAITIGTSAAARLVYDAATAVPRDGLFLYRLDGARMCEGGSLSDGGNLHAWLVRTLATFDDAELAARPPAAHGLTFLPFLGGERSLGWNPERRGSVLGLTFGSTALDLAQAATEAICYRLAAVVDAIGGVASFVATGTALHRSAAWQQILADVLGRSVEVSAVAESSARGAAVTALERFGLSAPPTRIARVVEPRPGYHEIHDAARREQEVWMRIEEER